MTRLCTMQLPLHASPAPPPLLHLARVHSWGPQCPSPPNPYLWWSPHDGYRCLLYERPLRIGGAPRGLHRVRQAHARRAGDRALHGLEPCRAGRCVGMRVCVNVFVRVCACVCTVCVRVHVCVLRRHACEYVRSGSPNPNNNKPKWRCVMLTTAGLGTSAVPAGVCNGRTPLKLVPQLLPLPVNVTLQAWACWRTRQRCTRRCTPTWGNAAWMASRWTARCARACFLTALWPLAKGGGSSRGVCACCLKTFWPLAKGGGSGRGGPIWPYRTGALTAGMHNHSSHSAACCPTPRSQQPSQPPRFPEP